MTEMVVAALLVPFLMFPAYVVTESARELAQDVMAAIDATMPRKVAAGLMRLSEADLSVQLSGLRPLNVYRLSWLPTEFWDVLLDHRAKRLGGLYLKGDVVAVLRGAAALRKPMAKMLASLPAERKLA
jgi:hypothetical protein